MKHQRQKLKLSNIKRIKQWTIEWLRFCWVSTNNRAIMCLLFRCQVLGIVCCHYLNIHDDLLWQKGDARTLCWYNCRATTIWKSCVTTNPQYLARKTKIVTLTTLWNNLNLPLNWKRCRKPIEITNNGPEAVWIGTCQEQRRFATIAWYDIEF